ncbi:MAG TPA: NADH-quinone oxidoreductase subunit D [Streptosporangiaceae bacterium]|nr:NADH-quinone oxidoreductase subunit D [Streptosporangiaceae bacterium]
MSARPPAGPGARPAASGQAGASEHLTASTGGWPGAGGPPDVLINLGASHPSGHGMLRLRLTLDAGVISGAEPEIGFMHRGAEKLFEARDYRQILVLANRHDWLGAFASELGVVLAAERLAGVEVPPRAVWARTLLAELNRVLSHLAFLSVYPPETVADTAGTGDRAARAAFAARETVQAVMEEISGGRMHYMFNRVGGLKEEIPLGWLDRVHRAVDEVRTALPAIGAAVAEPGFRARTRGVGRLTAGQVRQYGVSGPAARASGVDFDLRRDEPYLAYGDLAGVLRVVTRTEGDCLARFECLLDQAGAALDLADACATRLGSLPPGPLAARIPKVFKVPEGHAYVWTENPLGLNGYYLVSRGGKTPWRLKLRSASFSNVAVLAEVLPGHRVSDLAAIVGSLFFVVGDVDR